MMQILGTSWFPISIIFHVLTFRCIFGFPSAKLQPNFLNNGLNPLGCEGENERKISHSIIWMGDRIPKKRKKEKSKSEAESTSFDANARRVDPNLNISMRKQIMLAKLLKAAEKQGAQNYRKPKIERTSYRRKKIEEEELPPLKEEMAAALLPTTCLVDGYNIIGAWPKLKKKMEKDELDIAREMLINDLVELKYFKGWHVVVVFDGYRRNGELTVDHTGHGIDVVFTGGGYTADNYIETKTIDLNKEGCREILVATNDNIIRGVALAHGGMILSAPKIIQEIKTAKKSSEEAAKNLKQASAYATRIDRNLDSDSLEVLQDLEDDAFLRDFNEDALKHMPRAMKKLMIEKKETILEKRAQRKHKQNELCE
mmetsp:Transcript_14758/g.19455  ORF Transcript_14758/g.19455 Transcript_14758/m.19455 type:complete len:370 (+) Transcript_14758:156-1265(+)